MVIDEVLVSVNVSGGGTLPLVLNCPVLNCSVLNCSEDVIKLDTAWE